MKIIGYWMPETFKFNSFKKYDTSSSNFILLIDDRLFVLKEESNNRLGMVSEKTSYIHSWEAWLE